MVAGRNLSLSSLLVFTSTISLSQGFAPLPGLVRTQRRGLAAIQPEHIDSLHHLSSILLSDTDALVDAVTSIVDTANAVADPSLADAATAAVTDAAASSDATAVADAVSAAQDVAIATAAAAAATDDGGWWQAYLNVFKSTLLLIHNTIDGPLREQGITQTWGIAIAIFTFCARSILVPLSVQQTKSAEYTKALKPYMKEIKEKFKDNQEAQNRATAKLFEDANQNPLSGCFLSIAQLPVLLGLYRGIRLLAKDGELDEPFLWIPTLQGPVSPPDFRGMGWLTEGWVSDGSFPPTPQLGWETTLAFLIMPVVLVLGQSLTMSVLTPQMDDEGMSEDEKQQMSQTQGVLKFLPLMIGYFSLQVPAGLTIYWFVSNIFSLTQSLLVKGYYAANPPEIELPDYWDSLDDVENMTSEEKRKAAEAGLNVGPTMDDLIDESNFHIVNSRDALREDSEAWERVLAGSRKLAAELEEWVAQGPPPPPSPPSDPEEEPSLQSSTTSTTTDRVELS